jgi:hypothetical protein
MVRIVLFIIKWIIRRHFEKLASELYSQGKYIQHAEASEPPPGYVRVSSHLRRKATGEPNMKIIIEKESWNAGYGAGLEGSDAKPHPAMDGHAWWAGYIEGKSKRFEQREEKPA